jgi:hypothetical protein
MILMADPSPSRTRLLRVAAFHRVPPSGGVATVHDELLATDEIDARLGEEAHRSGDIGGSAEPAEWGGERNADVVSASRSPAGAPELRARLRVPMISSALLTAL